MKRFLLGQLNYHLSSNTETNAVKKYKNSTTLSNYVLNIREKWGIFTQIKWVIIKKVTRYRTGNKS